MIMAITDPQDFELPPKPFEPPSAPGWPFRGERPMWAPSSGHSREERAAIDRMFETTEGPERRAALMASRVAPRAAGAPPR
jgi:hypothetical protein